MTTLSATLLLATFAFAGLFRGDASDPRPIAPIQGSLVLASDGSLPDCVLQSFLSLSGGSTSEIVLVSGRGEPKTKRWIELGATSVVPLHLHREAELRSDNVLLTLLNTDAIWFEDVAVALLDDALFAALVRGILERGGVVGGTGDGAIALASSHLDGRDRRVDRGLGLLPQSVVSLDHRASKDRRLAKALEQKVGFVGFGISRGTALVVHHGRRGGAMGTGEVTTMIAEHDSWPERLQRFESVDVVDHGDLPPYRLDLLAWRRAAQQRGGPLFPPTTVTKPRVERGTLILHGGSGVGDETFGRFVDEAGGTDAFIVCIPSAAEIDAGDEPDSYSALQLRERGCGNVFILHTTDSRVADRDEIFLAPLRKATGVWIDGGRTYRVMDSYEHTTAQRLMFDVLDRGGVVAGSSAGCQVLGDFLVRGNPSSNQQLVYDGYTTGFGFLRGVIIDAHFLQRDRGAPFEELMRLYPQMLGIGVDEKTALVVQGATGHVIGENAVSFYDLSAEGRKKLDLSLVVLERGESYDLSRRARLK